jgi:hypothetical protein
MSEFQNVNVTKTHQPVLKVPQVLKVIMAPQVLPVDKVLKVSKVQPDLWEIILLNLQLALKDRWVLLEMLHFQE